MGTMQKGGSVSNFAIIGGSGTIGNAMVPEILKSAHVNRLVIFSRGESVQATMKETFPEYPENVMRYMIGDVRDVTRLTEALRGIDYVIHAAAQKRVETCEYDPEEAYKTNIIGSMNVVKSCHSAGVKKCILLSTDKACEPITNYGATKLCAERLFISGNNLGECRFSVCRYANVEGSRGSVLPLWEKQAQAEGIIKITDKRMTRMWISKEDAAKFVLSKFNLMQGGEIFVPDLKGVSLLAMAEELASKYGVYEDGCGEQVEIEEIGMRPNEKLHEVLISESDARNCWKTGDFYTVYPTHHDWTIQFIISTNAVRMPETFRLTSELK